MPLAKTIKCLSYTYLSIHLNINKNTSANQVKSVTSYLSYYHANAIDFVYTLFFQ